ncbi:M28 family peptidase [Pedobacter changchengzhani]|uniref:M28 family peptidase n=1 Tax=Pedobacter changchengzhani TaxID=2529274 RepID=A0A4R5MKX9_9SPHI|nr:M28 family peptidase [Pedobacter changchengzhani]TDG36086.1 M28 family peptidase [Pedobacter changchengzhani]
MHSSKNNMYADVEFLTSIRPYRNYKNLGSLKAVSDYIKQEFTKIGLPCTEQKWQAKGEEYTNIIASYNTSKTKRLIVGAHYDVCGDQDGADDNASAIAGLLETARIIAHFAPNLDYRIDFVAYCLEEPPFFATELMGSYVHAKSLKDANTEVLGMICYEMIGYFSDVPHSQSYPNATLASLYPSTANFIVVVGKQEFSHFNNQVHQFMRQKNEIDVQVISFPTGDDLAGLSDHRNYWAFDYPALMINDTSFIRNPNYHQVTDTIETLNFDKMCAVVNCTYHAIVNL